MAHIQLSSVTKSYPMGSTRVTALRDLNLSVGLGRVAVLLGPSGCGKTTTLNLIGGLDRATSGSVRVGETDVARLSERDATVYRRRRVGFVFQFFNLIPTLTAAENVEFALVLDKERRNTRAASLALLELVGLRDSANHFPAQLSGGEQQRVSIARAFANEPEVLLCDEPTGNLDAETGRGVLAAVRELNRVRGTTVLLVTHNSSIGPYADIVVHLRNGAVDRVDDVDSPVPASELSW